MKKSIITNNVKLNNEIMKEQTDEMVLVNNSNQLRFRESSQSPIGKTNENTTYEKSFMDDSGMGRWGICQTLNYWKKEVKSQYMFYRKNKECEKVKIKLNNNQSVEDSMRFIRENFKLSKCKNYLETIKN